MRAYATNSTGTAYGVSVALTTESATDGQLGRLTKAAWTITSVTQDGIDKTGNYSGFQLTLTGIQGNTTFNFTTAGRPSLSPWAQSGSFTFDGTNPSTTLSRDDAVTVTYVVTETTLQMSFQYTGAGYSGRVANVQGNWIFSFGH